MTLIITDNLPRGLGYLELDHRAANNAPEGLPQYFETDTYTCTQLGLGGTISDAFSSLDDGCFITTACMKAHAADFDDNCLELTLLRQVRDEYIANLPEGAKLLAAYREYASQYVTLINAQPDSEKIWQELYTDFILPAVRYAQDGLFKKAYLTYLFMLQHVQGVTGLRSE